MSRSRPPAKPSPRPISPRASACSAKLLSPMSCCCSRFTALWRKSRTTAMPLEFFRDILDEHFAGRRSGAPDRDRAGLGPLRRHLHVRFRNRPAVAAPGRKFRESERCSAALDDISLGDEQYRRKRHRRLRMGNHFPPVAVSLVRDLPIILAGLALFYGLLSFARYWVGPVSTQAEIDLHPSALPKYALFSVLRLTIAYGFSLVFTLVYGYVAAHNRRPSAS